MSGKKKSSVFPCLILIIACSLLLINKLFPGYLNWRHVYPLVLLLLGLFLILSVFVKRKTDKGAVFPGTLLFLIGLFFFLRNFELVEYYYVREVWPIFLVIACLGFLALFFVNPRDTGNLVPATILVALGVLFLLKQFYVIDIELGEIIADYWPIILILVGLSIILGSFRRRNQIEN